MKKIGRKSNYGLKRKLNSDSMWNIIFFEKKYEKIQIRNEFGFQIM